MPKAYPEFIVCCYTSACVHMRTGSLDIAMAEAARVMTTHPAAQVDIRKLHSDEDAYHSTPPLYAYRREDHGEAWQVRDVATGRIVACGITVEDKFRIPVRGRARHLRAVRS